MVDSQEVDWRFDIPPELKGKLVYTDKNTTVDQDTNNDSDIDYTINLEEELPPEADYDSIEGLNAPGDITIVEQQVVTLIDGTQLIDLVLDIENIYGATSYTVKYVKI